MISLFGILGIQIGVYGEDGLSTGIQISHYEIITRSRVAVIGLLNSSTALSIRQNKLFLKSKCLFMSILRCLVYM